MKTVTNILLLVLLLTAAVIVYTVMSGRNETVPSAHEAAVDPALPAAEQAALLAQARVEDAREFCRHALLDVLERPETAKLSPPSSWAIDEPPDGTIHVRLSAQITTALDVVIDGTWNCVVLSDDQGLRLVTLALVDS
jgi:hypothetical protein